MPFPFRTLSAILLIASAMPARAQMDEMRPVAFSDADRAAAGDRTVRLSMTPTEIGTSYVLGEVADLHYANMTIGNYYYTWSFTDGTREALSSNLHDQAEAMAAPVRLALQGFDVDALALEAARSGLSGVVGFRAGDLALSKEPPERDRKGALIVPKGEGQVAFLLCRYDLSHDFSQVRVTAFLEIIEGAPAKPRPGAVRTGPRTVLRQQMMSVIALESPSYEAKKNVARWSADHGALTRGALERGFHQLAELIARAVALKPADITAFSDKKREQVFANGYNGPLVAADADGPGKTLWSTGLIHVETVR